MEIQDIFRQMQAEENRLYAKKTGYSPDEYIQFKFFSYYQQDLKSAFPRIHLPLYLLTHHHVTHTEIGFTKVLFYIMQIIFSFKNKSIPFHLHAMFLQLVE